MSAVDPDVGANGQVRYRLSPESSHLRSILSVHERSGWVTTLKPLDRERADTYRLTVTASDQGERAGVMVWSQAGRGRDGGGADVVPGSRVQHARQGHFFTFAQAYSGRVFNSKNFLHKVFLHSKGSC